MKKNLGQFFYFILGVIILIALGGGVFFVLKAILQATRDMNETQKTLIVVTITLLAPIIGTYLTNRQTKIKDFELRNREKKEKTYDDFVSLLFQYIYDSARGKESSNRTFLKLIDARKNLVVWGSDEVVKTYSDYMKYSQNQEGLDQEYADNLASTSFESLIKAIRKDLGYKNQKIISGDIGRFFK